jgi:ribosomal protein L32E
MQNFNVIIIHITSTLLKPRKPKGKWQKIKPQLTQTKSMHQNHIELTSPSKLQLPGGMEQILIYKIVEQTSKPQARNVLSIDCKTWI